MSLETFWVCDGCDKRLRWREGMGTDWKTATITLGGFRGYPTSASADPEHSSYHLCPDCARQLWSSAHPRQWPRNAAAPSQEIKE